MKRSIRSAAILCLLAAPAAAEQQCGSWDASMQEDEGGPQMMATVCSQGAGNPGHIILVCGKPGEIGFRYLPGQIAQAPSDVPNFKGAFHIASDSGTVNLMLSYEGMDGAYTSYVKTSHDLLKVMKSGKQVTVSGPFKPETFSLNGSSKAVAKLEKACKG